MRSTLTEHRNTDGKSPTSALLLRSPLDFITEDHLRLRAMCAEIDRMADAGVLGAEDVRCLRDYLTHELPALLADEDDALLPFVMLRAEPEDDLPQLVDRLSSEHASIDVLAAKVLEDIEGPATGREASPALRSAMRRLAAVARRHLILENAVLLPLARVRLLEEDMIALRQCMLRRRGLERLFDD